MARNSLIKFYRNVNLDTSSGNTYYFASRSAQTTFFASKLWKTVSGTSYLREGRGYVRVYETMSDLLKCDYMSFSNPDYENRTFYAFITGVTYIGDHCQQVDYEIDLLQTWLLDCTFKACMIDRNHTATDTLFGNILPETFESGEMVTNYQRVYSLNKFSVIFQATFDIFDWIQSNFQTKSETHCYIRSDLYDGYSMVGMEVYKSSSNKAGNGSMFAKMLECIFQTAGDVSIEDFVNIWIYPTDLVQEVDKTLCPLLTDTSIDIDLRSYWKVGNAKRMVDNFIPTFPTAVDGYTPKNKKMFTYPYTLLHVTNCDGNAIDYKFERFNTSVSGGVYPFVLSGTTTNEGKIRLTPGDYMGVNDPNITNAQYDPSDFLSLPYEFSIDSMAYPIVSVIGDVYNIYYAQNHNRIENYYEGLMVSGVSDVLSFVLNPIGGIASSGVSNPAGQANSPTAAAAAQSGAAGAGAVGAFAAQSTASAIQYIKNKRLGNNEVVAAWQDMKIAPNEAKGIQSVGLAYQHGFKGYIFEIKTCDKYRARALDDYWTIYGYPIRHIANPGSLLHNRPSWTYIKTSGCSLSGQIPEYVKNVLEQLFDAGLTFWDSSKTIGDYSQSNTPT